MTPLGHRIGYEAGVHNVTGYTGMPLMPTADQLQETISTLRAEGGELVILGEGWWSEVPSALSAAGFRQVASERYGEFVAWRDMRTGRP
jgi:hypothetical protein